MNPLALIGWILIGGVGAIAGAIILAIVVLIVRLSFTVDVGRKSVANNHGDTEADE